MNRRPRSALAVVPFALLLVFAAPLAQGEANRDELHLSLKQQMLARINRDRAMYDLPPVQLDIQASIVADAYCERQIRNGTTGHFTLDGQAPYMRYSFAGGNDGLSENAAAWSANYPFQPNALGNLVERSQNAMMAEKPPHDGHRRAILDPTVTHVGLGIAWQGGEFRLAQEFLRRYLTWTRPLPRTITLGQVARLEARPVDGFRATAVTVHYEPLPQTISAQVANLIDTYSIPKRRREYLPRFPVALEHGVNGSVLARYTRYSDGRNGDFTIDRDGTFEFAIPFPDGPGVYTVVVWVTREGLPEPIAASNVSIRVDRPAAGSAGIELAR